MRKIARRFYQWAKFHLLYFLSDTYAYCNVQLALDKRVMSKKIIFRIFRQKYEVQECRVVKEYCKKDDVILELGTGVGFISLFASQYCSFKNIYTFEANPLLIPLIKRNFELNKCFPTVQNCLLVNNPVLPHSDFYVCEDFYSSSLSRPAQYKEVIKVENRDFSETLNAIRPNFLIVDIEGFEYELLNNIQLPSFVQKILIELHPHKTTCEVDLVDKFQREGFEIDMEKLQVNQLAGIRLHGKR